ncbi:DMT family transporter [Aestuariispira insulae]|uniref:Threonine/homoserine efflux transporter RhtA n=1 Tax=Aestuariispira insulae TaxID=1461337 RepID=A0A3D9HIM4_9PROT|nr:DMT family transporter [Aestuariispira insulae]RED49121.1 threonine/homoserine efflux transporter RhtA [Aestuariispira insulae]
MQNLGLYLSTVLIWGSTWIVITFQLGVVDPILSLAYRFGLGALILFAFCLVMGRLRNKALGTRNHLFIALQGLFLFCLNYWVFYIATGYLASGLVAVMFSTIAVMNIINQAIFFKIRVKLQVVIAAIFGLAGIALVFRPEIETLDLSDNSVIGLALCLLATYLASIGNMFVIRNRRANLPVIETNAYGMAYGAAISFLIAIAADVPVTFDTSFDYIWSLVYLAVLGSAIAFGCYLTLVGRIGADRASYAAVLFPVVALTLSTLFEGYVWSLDAIFGVSLILVGNVLALSPSSLLTGLFRKSALSG